MKFLYINQGLIFHTFKPSAERHARAPACEILDAPLKPVQTMRLKSLATGNPLE